ncbi:MAG TPA: uridylate kinase [Anaerolineaceae bacterium]|nr:uridylate kinase [Anaerolineaceae bacterium]
MNPSGLTFLKLGGSLITDKSQPLTAKHETIRQIAHEIADFRQLHPETQLLIGHGSGSFGHAVASQYQTQKGGTGGTYWKGFADVWQAARELNQILIEICYQAGLPVISFPPSAGVISRDQELVGWDLKPMELALSHNLIPFVQGDVIFDSIIGGTIFSTEKIFQYLCSQLNPERILLAGLEAGVYSDPQEPENVYPKITPSNFEDIRFAISGSQAEDVTGGMLSKVEMMLTLVEKDPEIKIQIFSGLKPGNIKKALAGETLGTSIGN